MIEVIYKNEILGIGILWLGEENRIEEIRNIPARLLAEKVILDGKTRHDGMWTVRRLEFEDYK